MKRLASLLLLSFAVSAHAAPDLNAKRFTPEEVPAGTYELFSDETLVRYTVDHMGFNDYWGTFAGATGMVKRSEFGLGKWVPIVSDETRIFISAEFKKQ